MSDNPLLTLLNNAAAANSLWASKVKVGHLPTLRDVFEVPDAMARVAATQKALADHPNIELVNLADAGYADGIVRPENDIAPAWKHLINSEVEVVLAQPGNYGHEGHTADVCRRVHNATRCPVFTFAAFDGPPRQGGELHGTRPTDATCGIYPMRQELRHAWIPAGYIPMSDIGDQVFNAGLDNMLRICKATSGVHWARILQVGGSTPTFPAIVADLPRIYRQWGVRVETAELLTMVESVRAMMADQPAWLDEAIKQIYDGVDTREAEAFDMDVLKNQTLMLYWLLKEVEAQKCYTLTVRCWPEVLQATKAMACFVLGMCNQAGLMTSCETDIYGALSLNMALGASLGAETPFFADNTITLEDGRILIWHCGPFAKCLARQGETPCLRKGWILPDPGAGYLHCRCLELGDTVTLVRISQAMNGALEVLTHEGVVVEGPETRGTHLYILPSDWPKLEAELMDSNCVHHWAVVRGSYAHIFQQAARWLGVGCDTLDTDPKEIEARLRCEGARPMNM